MAISKTYKCRFCGKTFEGKKDYFVHLYNEKVKASPLQLYTMLITINFPIDKQYMSCSNVYTKMIVYDNHVFADNSGKLHYYSSYTAEDILERNKDISEEEMDSRMDIVSEDEQKGKFWDVIKPQKWLSETTYERIKTEELRDKTIALLELYGDKFYHTSTRELRFSTKFSDWGRMKNRLVEFQKAMPVDWIREQVRQFDEAEDKKAKFIVEQTPVLLGAVKETLLKPELQEMIKKCPLEEQGETRRVCDIHKMFVVPAGMYNSLNMVVDGCDRREWK